MKIKEKLIHWLGGITKKEIPINKKFEIIHTEYHIVPIKFNYKYFLGTPKEHIEEEVIKAISKYILDNKLYYSQTINSSETPQLLCTSYTVLVASSQNINK